MGVSQDRRLADNVCRLPPVVVSATPQRPTLLIVVGQIGASEMGAPVTVALRITALARTAIIGQCSHTTKTVGRTSVGRLTTRLSAYPPRMVGLLSSPLRSPSPPLSVDAGGLLVVTRPRLLTTRRIIKRVTLSTWTAP